MSRARGEMIRYVVAGLGCILIDLAVYRMTMFIGLSTALAKTLGCLVSTTASYFVNRTWTFRADRNAARLREAGTFIVVYGVSILANVAINEAILALLGRSEVFIAVAFLVATAASAVCNFIGMKFVVFSFNAEDR